MKKRLILFFIFVVIAVNSALSITPMQLKESRLKVYDWVRDYQVYMNFEEKRNPGGKFKSLFVSSDISIFNDYYPQTDYNFHNPYIKLEDYVQLALNSPYKIQSKISNVQVVSEELEDNHILYVLKFTKSVSFILVKGVLRYEYPDISNECIIHISYDLDENTILADKLRLANDTKKIAPFIIIHDNNDENTYTTEHKLKETCKDKVQNPIITIDFEKTKIDETKGIIDPKIMHFESDTIKNSVGIYGFSGIGQYFFKNNSFYNVNKINYDAGLGFDYYRQLYLRNKNRFGIDLGVKYLWSRYNLSGNYYEEYYDTDPDGGDYLRKIQVSNYRENINSYALAVPIKLRYDYFFSKNISVFSKIGIGLQFEMGQISKVRGDVLYSGYYTWLYDVEIDKNGIYDFGHFSLDKNKLKNKATDFNLNVTAEVGLAYYVTSKISLDVSFSYDSKVFNLKKDNAFHLTRYDGDLNSSYNAFNKLNSHSVNINVQLNYNF